jgi:threonine-phosphate decarboxylase
MIHDTHGGNTFAYQNVKLDFSVNLNPLGLQPEIIAALRAHAADFDAYPDTECRQLRAALAQFENVSENMLVFGNGAADLIVRICMALRPRKALVTAPTFSEYEKAVLESGGQIARFPLKEINGFQITSDFATAITPDTDIVFLCNPNNPTGRLAEEGTIASVAIACQACGAILVVDECFIEFTDGVSCKSLLERFDNLILLKAFTKIYSVAGLRLGYTICTNQAINQKISAWGQSWSISTPAQVAGLAALQIRDHLTKTKTFVRRERAWMFRQLARLPIRVYPSDSNFLLFKSKQHTLWESALNHGILLRACANFYGLDNHYYRIGLKQRKENEELISVLTNILYS